ncbi:MAG: hypothetical protein ACLFMT_00350 [Halobacteriales archaeon]
MPSRFSFLRRQLEIAFFVLVIAVAFYLVGVLVPMSYLPHYAAAWVAFLAARVVREADVGFVVDLRESGGGVAVLTFVEGIAVFLFAYISMMGFFRGDLGLLVAALVGVFVGMYSLTT